MPAAPRGESLLRAALMVSMPVVCATVLNVSSRLSVDISMTARTVVYCAERRCASFVAGGGAEA